MTIHSASMLGLLALVFVEGCATDRDINGVVRAHSNHPDLYLVYFRYGPFIENYTVGWDSLANEAERKHEELSVIVDDAVKMGIPNYLNESRLIPTACTHGIDVVSAMKDEGGGGTAAFKCRVD
tara:strand:- start:48 stop:419 length:372 start_codon:yes stop_codon:yes gene_type:complete